MRQAAGEEGPRGPRGPHAAPARVHTGLRSQGERGTHRSVQGGCLTPTPTSHRPEVQRVADDAPVGGTQFPEPSSGRSGGSRCPPPRGWRWLWVPRRLQAGTGLPGTCGALCYALVDGLVLKNHAPAAGGSFPPSPAQPGGCHRRAPQTCPGAEGHPLRVGVPPGWSRWDSHCGLCGFERARAPTLAVVVGQPNVIPGTEWLPVLQPDQPGLRDALGRAEDGAAAKRLGLWSREKVGGAGHRRGRDPSRPCPRIPWWVRCPGPFAAGPWGSPCTSGSPCAAHLPRVLAGWQRRRRCPSAGLALRK